MSDSYSNYLEEANEILERCNKEIHTITRINYWKDRFNELRGMKMSVQQFKILFNLNYTSFYIDDFIEESLLLQYNLEYKGLI